MERPIFNRQFREKLIQDGFSPIDLEQAMDGRRSSAKVLRDWTGYSNKDINEGFFQPEKEEAERRIYPVLLEELVPWMRTSTTQDLPVFQAKAIARATGLSVEKVVNMLSRYPFAFSIGNQEYVSIVSKPVFDRPQRLTDCRSLNVPAGIVERDSRYLSRPPGGGPVQKARVLYSKVNSIVRKKAWENRRIGFAPLSRVQEELGGTEKNSQYDIFSLFANLAEESVYKSVFPEKIIERMIEARMTGEPLTLFVPWGTRLEGSIGPEVDVLDRIAQTAKRFQNIGINTQVLILPADSYATQINQVDAMWTADYFREISWLAEVRGFAVIPWSQFKADNQKEYDAIAKDLDEDTINTIISPYTLRGALLAAGRRSGYSKPEDVRKAAYTYLRERICEGIMIDRIYRPIKMSGVTKKKDNDIDGPLPRMYLVPPALQFSWLK